MKKLVNSITWAMLFLLSAFPLFAQGQKSIPKTISRTEDPILVLGRDLKGILGAPLDSLSLMSFDKGSFKPIPFQIDERLPNGEYAFNSGKLASKDPEPNFDENDELVFMANDLGDKAPAGLFPKNAEKGMELEIIDPVNQAKAWVYLFKFSQNPPSSEIDYVRFEPSEKHKRVYGQGPTGYGVIMGSPINAVYPDEFRVIFPDGAIAEDILDRQKIRGTLITKLGLDIDFKFDVLTKVKLCAWNDGAVRVIYRADGYLELGILKFSGKGYSIITYYRNSLVWPMALEMPFSLAPILKDVQIRGYMDYNQNVLGAKVYSETNPPPPKIFLDGKISDEEKALDYQSECNWIAGYSHLGATINRLFFPEEWSMVKKRFYLNEDLSKKATPEDDPGEIAVGYEFDNFIKVFALKATYYQYYYFLPKLEPGEERMILNILDHPLQVNGKKIL